MATTFLATVIGWYLVIVGLFILIRQDYVRLIMADLFAQKASVFIVAVVTLILGLLLVVSHHVWVMGWPVVITVFAWLVLVSGVVRLIFPELAIKMGRGMMNQSAYLNGAAVVLLLVGVFLLYKAYFS